MAARKPTGGVAEASGATAAVPDRSPPDHRHGHRERVRERLLASGGRGIPDYEILELVLATAIPRRDTKEPAKALLATFGSLGAVLNAQPEDLVKVKGIGTAAVAALKVVHEAAARMLRDELADRPVLSSFDRLSDYLRIRMAGLMVEQFRVLFLNTKLHLIKDEVMQEGTINEAPVFPREVVRRALELGAHSVFLVHNHPTGDPTPSQSDIEITRRIREAARAVGIEVHDHVIVGARQVFSFRNEGLMR